MTKADFENTKFSFDTKISYKGEIKELITVYFADYKVGIHNPNCLNQERIISCKDIEIVP